MTTLDARGASLVCSSCGGDFWRGFGPLANLGVHLFGVTPHGEIIRTGEEVAGIDAFPLTCGNCGFISLHSLEVLENPLPEREDEAP